MILSVEHAMLKRKYLEQELAGLPHGSVTIVKTHAYSYEAVWLSDRRRYYATSKPEGQRLLGLVRRAEQIERELVEIDEELQRISEAVRSDSRIKRRNEPVIMRREFLVMIKQTEDSNPYPKPESAVEHNGILMRSKGEKIIAEVLDSLGYEYSYESRIWIGRFIYPDFSIYIPEIDKVIFVEFMGAVDKHDYSAGARRKFADFTSYGFIPGRDVFFVCETEESVADTDLFKLQLNAAILANTEVL